MNAPTQHHRILIVEDNADQRDLLCDSLRLHYQRERQAVDVLGVGTGAECLRQDLDGFDVVLLDYHLPDMAGLAVLEKVRSAADVPVIFVTGENDSAVAAEAIKRGAQDYVVKLGDYLFAIPVVIGKTIGQHLIRKENEDLQRQLQLRLRELQVKNAELEESRAQLQKMATTDHLTDLPNRRRFCEVLHRKFNEAVRYQFDLSCCMCDLDHYKQLNDALGHQFGDDVLVTTADVIRATLRQSDNAARYGGDEFVLLLSHTDSRQALAVGRRLREQLVERIGQFAGFGGTVTLSVGIASLAADHPTSADVLVSMADRALYTAKTCGKNRIVLFNEAEQAALST